MIPCDCPKGGLDGEGRVCYKCNGEEWVSPHTETKETGSPTNIQGNSGREDSVLPNPQKSNLLSSSPAPKGEKELQNTEWEKEIEKVAEDIVEECHPLAGVDEFYEGLRHKLGNLISKAKAKVRAEENTKCFKRKIVEWEEDMKKAITEERSRIRKEIEGMKKEPDCSENEKMECTTICGYNKAINEILSLPTPDKDK